MTQKERIARMKAGNASLRKQLAHALARELAAYEHVEALQVVVKDMDAIRCQREMWRRKCAGVPMLERRIAALKAAITRLKNRQREVRP
jgi:hypothetical protein